MTRRRRWAAAVAATVIAGVAVIGLVFRGGSTPVPVDDVVAQFRNATPAPERTRAAPTATPRQDGSETPTTSSFEPHETKTSPATELTTRPQPPEGVYVYATEGGDEVDVLGGSRHTYPDETTVTIRHTACGTTERWDVLEERWDERDTCISKSGDRLDAVRTYHEFFGQGDIREMRCTGFTYPAAAEPGDEWRSECSGAEGKASTLLRAVGIEMLDVAGEPVETLHVQATTKVTGGQSGTSKRDVWGSTQTGLVVRERAVVDTDGREPVIGDVHYHESYEINLTSFEPKR